jgi:hypothetical protein
MLASHISLEKQHPRVDENIALLLTPADRSGSYRAGFAGEHIAG